MAFQYIKYVPDHVEKSVIEYYYLIKENGQPRAVFMMTEKPGYSKHLIAWLHVFSDTLEYADALEKTAGWLLKLYYYVFKSVLEITEREVTDSNFCRIHADFYTLRQVYPGFADKLEEKGYRVKKYKGWIEINKPENSRQR